MATTMTTTIRESPFETAHIESVNGYKDAWEIQWGNGWCFSFDAKSGVKPRVGDSVSFYGNGIGRTIRGLAINGRTVFYRTEEEQKERDRMHVLNSNHKAMEEFEDKRSELNAQYNALPVAFKRRIDKFRTNNPDFRWKYESYEMFVCTEAMKIAEAMNENAKSIEIFAGLSYAEQMRQVKLADGHSGNTFGAAVHLAWMYSTDPENVVLMHGALAPLVGSEEYGCVPRDVTEGE